MSSTIEMRDFIIDQIGLETQLVSKPMMGEFLLYFEGVLFGGIYDDRFLVKIVPTNEHFSLPSALPYAEAKPMYWVQDLVDNSENLREIVWDTCKGLKPS